MQTFWIILSALALNSGALTLMFFYFRRLVRRTLELDEVLDRARQEIGGMIAELNQTADRNVSLIEDRIERAKSLIDTAEKRFELLARESGQRSREREIFERLSRAGASVQMAGRNPINEAAAPPAEGVPRPVRLEGSASDRREAETASMDVPGAAPPEVLPTIGRRAETVDTGPSPAEKAVGLWERGFSPELIAPKLGMTVAEIDLIISMEEQRRLLGR